MTDFPTEWSVAEVTGGIGRGDLTALQVAEVHLERITQRSELNAFIRPLAASAREAAVAVDTRHDGGTSCSPRPLDGVPVAIKDNICVAGVPCTCGSRMLEHWVPPYEATVVTRLRAAGAVIVGKTNLDEFGMGSSTENSFFGAVRNPHDPTRTPGGSSGGSAVAVADRQCIAALGSDTGGSVRLPAAHCGVIGLKPTYGSVSRWGLVAFASSLDQIGVFGRTVADTRAVYDVICGPDPQDSTAMPECDRRAVPERLTVGLPAEYFGEGLDPEIASAIERVAETLRQAGHEVVDVSLPHARYATAAYYIICTAEGSSNLARYDGVKYGHRSAVADDLAEMYAQTRAEGFGDEVKRRILLGTHVLSAGYYDAYYGKAQSVRALIAGDFAAVFRRVDCLLTPTAPTCAFKLGEKIDDPLAMYLSDVYTTSVNLAGLPAASVPCGRNAAGLPIGAQVIGRAFEEHVVLKLAEQIEGVEHTERGQV